MKKYYIVLFLSLQFLFLSISIKTCYAYYYHQYANYIYTYSYTSPTCPSGYTLSGSYCTEQVETNVIFNNSSPFSSNQVGVGAGGGSSCTNGSCWGSSPNTITISTNNPWSTCSPTELPGGITLGGNVMTGYGACSGMITLSSPSGITGGTIACNLEGCSTGGTVYFSGSGDVLNFWGSANGTITLQYITPTCPSGYSWNGSTCTGTTTQTASATCLSGSTLSGSQCISYTCPLGSGDTCIAPSGSSTYYCSPDSCSNYSDSSSYTLNNPPINANNPTNNGTTNSAGQCLGQVYIFEGTALQCRNPGIQTVSSCCQGETHAFFGMKQCNSQEQELAEQEQAGDCNMVGTYCAESFLGMCLQTDQVWCCFPSLLAEIIQYQARANQGIPAPNFGTAESPNCIGFTPQQFQAINFSQINLSAFYNSIEKSVSSAISSAATNAVGKLEQETP